MEQLQDDRQLTLVLKITNINHILSGLREIKYRDADPIIREITRQAQLQLTMAEEVEPVEEAEEVVEEEEEVAQ